MRRSLLRLSATIAQLCAALTLAAIAPSGRAEELRVALVPDRAPPWRASRLLDSLREGAREPRDLRIETLPSGAQLALGYLRDGAQIAHARGASPLVATLPGRALTGECDRVIVHAELPGYAPAELALDLRELEASLQVELAPLPRTLLAVSLLELGGRSRLELSSDRAIDVRLATTERGWRLGLVNLAASARFVARLEALRGAAIARTLVRVAGGDWIVELVRSPDERRAPRLLRREESIRGAHHLALEWSQGGSAEHALDEARVALSRLAADPLGVCSQAFEDSLVSALGRDALARSVALSGAFTDPYVGVALEALAARSANGELTLRDDSRLRVDTPLARELAATRAAEVRGALVAIRALSHALAPPGGAQRTLHAWLAPELAPEEFAAILARAAAAEAHCNERT